MSTSLFNNQVSESNHSDLRVLCRNRLNHLHTHLHSLRRNQDYLVFDSTHIEQKLKNNMMNGYRARVSVPISRSGLLTSCLVTMSASRHRSAKSIPSRNMSSKQASFISAFDTESKLFIDVSWLRISEINTLRPGVGTDATSRLVRFRTCGKAKARHT